MNDTQGMTNGKNKNGRFTYWPTYCSFSDWSSNMSMSCGIPILSAISFCCGLVCPASDHSEQAPCSFTSIDQIYKQSIKIQLTVTKSTSNQWKYSLQNTANQYTAYCNRIYKQQLKIQVTASKSTTHLLNKATPYFSELDLCITQPIKSKFIL